MKYGTMIYLVSKNDNVLMIRKPIRDNDPNSGYFTLPGGKLEKSEGGLLNPNGRIESVIRECFDETGINPIDPVLRGIILFDNKDRTFDNWKNPDNFLVYLFYAKDYRGSSKKVMRVFLLPFLLVKCGRFLQIMETKRCMNG